MLRLVSARVPMITTVPITCLRGKMVNGLTPSRRIVRLAAGALPQASEAIMMGIHGFWVTADHRPLSPRAAGPSPVRMCVLWPNMVGGLSGSGLGGLVVA